MQLAVRHLQALQALYPWPCWPGPGRLLPGAHQGVGPTASARRIPAFRPHEYVPRDGSRAIPVLGVHATCTSSTSLCQSAAGVLCLRQGGTFAVDGIDSRSNTRREAFSMMCRCSWGSWASDETIGGVGANNACGQRDQQRWVTTAEMGQPRCQRQSSPEQPAPALSR